MPALIEAGGHRHGSPAGLRSWISAHQQDLDQRLLRCGAVLLRGFRIVSAQAFHDTIAAIRPKLLDYVGGDSPRTALGDGVYTSTEFPPHMEIGLHNELSYTRSWPERLFFCCLVPAVKGGETQIADGRRVFTLMDPAVRDRFSSLGVTYQQHLRDNAEHGPGKSWQETFDTDDPSDVEKVCNDQSMDFRWTHRGLHTTLRNPGVLIHPVTGESCWFNQADLWHAGFDTVKAREHRTARDKDEEAPLGSYACYGDGSEIPIADLEAVRSAYGISEVLFSWEAGDLLVIDNVLAMHGRKPFEGERKVLVAMA
jgi:alpha-ketoglutarate-dependent taurine dioxygenase